MENQKDKDISVNEPTPKKKKKGGKGGLVWLIIVLVLVVLLGGGGFGYISYITNSPLPHVDGALKAHGLRAKVEVIRDTYGIPTSMGRTCMTYFSRRVSCRHRTAGGRWTSSVTHAAAE